MKQSELRQIIKEEIQKTFNEGIFSKFIQATVDNVTWEPLRKEFDTVIKDEDDVVDYVYDFIKEFSGMRYKQTMLGLKPFFKEKEDPFYLYEKARNKFEENNNEISVREIGEIVASNYLLKKMKKSELQQIIREEIEKLSPRQAAYYKGLKRTVAKLLGYEYMNSNGYAKYDYDEKRDVVSFYKYIEKPNRGQFDETPIKLSKEITIDELLKAVPNAQRFTPVKQYIKHITKKQ